jgi:hypothetical protein
VLVSYIGPFLPLPRRAECAQLSVWPAVAAATVGMAVASRRDRMVVVAAVAATLAIG